MNFMLWLHFPGRLLDIQFLDILMLCEALREMVYKYITRVAHRDETYSIK